MTDLQIYEEIVRLTRDGEASVLATVVESAGSSPRKAGAKMLVRGDGTIVGSVGGGRVELETLAAAREVLASGAPRTLSFTLTEEQGHVCGGRLLVYVEPTALPPRLIVIGAGHVGTAVTSVAKFAGYRVLVADERPEYADPARLPEAAAVFAGDPGAALEYFGVGADTAVVITTTGFEQDFAAVRAALATPARYIGVIGSSRKREVLHQTLGAEGYGPEALSRVTIPVGLPLGGDTPAEIAVSIVAQLIQVRRTCSRP